MSSIAQATVDGYNEYINGLKKERGVKLNLVLFDHEYETPISDMPIKDVPDLILGKTYQPRGSTALIDAVCRTLNTHKENVGKKDKALVVIITDGYENASHEYNSNQMKALVEGLTARDNWTFTYLGANQDAWSVAQDWGFAKGNVSSYNATAAGATAAFSTMSANTINYVRSSSLSTGDFYSDEDKAKLEATE
jgi:hypothetical protein